MSFREKSAWACLLTTVGVYIPYFVYVFVLYQRGELRVGAVFGAFVGTVILQVILGVAAHAVFAIQSRQERKDERDLAIEAKAITVSYYVLISSGFVAVSFLNMVASGRAPAQHVLATMLMSQILLLCLVVAEATRYLIQALGYRRAS